MNLSNDDRLWYKDAIIYELRVRSYYDSNGDGIGDFRGAIEKLDYLQDLGVTALWLLPFYPSPLRDDGYDISDYHEVHPDCGTLADFKTFLKEAHKRGMRVITELVINHTSDQHPWFQRARQAPPGSNHRKYYVWSDTTEKYQEARIIFKDFEGSNWAWDPVARQFYWHRFFAHQPDLNFDHPGMRKALFSVLDYWLKMGVDGLRLDAIPYLFEREGSNCENLPETYEFLKQLRRHVDERWASRMLLAEANQWPEDSVAYFGDGDSCHMAFHFPIMPRLFMSIHMEDRFPIIDILNQTPAIPESCQWALFLRNHDELTLEMVTDEERDYMYRTYAIDPQARINLGIRRRLAPLLGNDRRRIELMNGLLFSLPGTPVLYYGDEIGMGDNFYLGDRNGVRTPMQWSADRNAGFSMANPQRLFLPVIIDPEYHYEFVNVAVQQGNPNSLLWWTKHLIAQRKRHQAFGRGSIEFLQPQNRKILAFVRRYQDESILVVANLSHHVQSVELDLRAFAGLAPVEMFGGTRFPALGQQLYPLTLGPYDFFWFALQRQPAVTAAVPAQAPALVLKGGWDDLLSPESRDRLATLLPDYLVARPWFWGKGREPLGVRVAEAVPLGSGEGEMLLAIVGVEYAEGPPDRYLLPLAMARGEEAERIVRQHPEAVIARLTWQQEGTARTGLLVDALARPACCQELLDVVARRRRLKGTHGEAEGRTMSGFKPYRKLDPAALSADLQRQEHDNTCVFYGGQLVLKVIRRLEDGVNPELEIECLLMDQTGFRHIPGVAGTLEYRQPTGQVATLAILQGLVPNEGTAWDYTLDAVTRFYEQAMASPAAGRPPVPAANLLALTEQDPPPLVVAMQGAYLETARLLGQRTAQLHLALAGAPGADFAPEHFGVLYQRSLYQSMRNLTGRSFQRLRDALGRLPDEACDEARRVLGLEEQILERFHAITDRKLAATRIRVHGHYHLGQLLHTGKDFVIVDFEGDPARAVGERRIKRSPLRDAAGMVRSFRYAAYGLLLGQVGRSPMRPEDAAALQPWARLWYLWSGSAFLRAYLPLVAPLLPASPEDRRLLLDFFMLEHDVAELAYTLGRAPERLRLALHALLQEMGAEVPAAARK